MAKASKHTPITHLNLNTATKKQLQKLPGIGNKISEEIIAYRHQHGFFYSKRDLLKVKFIGPKLYEKLAQFLYL